MQNCQPNGSYMYTKRSVYVCQANIYISLGVHIGYATCTYTRSFGWQFRIHISDKQSENLAFPDNNATGRLKLRDRELNELYIWSEA